MEHENAPQFVCSDCYENVVNACSFKKVLEESDRKVRSYLEDFDPPALKIEYLESELHEMSSKDVEMNFEYEGNEETTSDKDYQMSSESENDQTDSEDEDITEESLSLKTTPKVSKFKMEVQKCFICDINFSSKTLKLAHFREHHAKEKNIKCLRCNHVAKNAVFYNIHLKNHKSNFGCHNCLRKFSTAEILELHKSNGTCYMKKNVSKSKRIRSQTCTDCFQIFTRKKDYEHHMSQKDGVTDCSKILPLPVTCFLCSKVFKFNYLKNKHLDEEHKMKEYKCTNCEASFKTARSLDRHLRSHYEDIPDVICEQCGKKFEYEGLLRKHIKSRHQNRPHYTCDLCGLVTQLKQSISRHISGVHLRVYRFSCAECGPEFSYANKTTYNAHLFKVHGKILPISCQDCGAGFSFSYELKNHKGKHGNCAKTKEYIRVVGKDNKIKWAGAKTWEYGYFTDKKREIFCKVCHKR